MDVVSTGTRGIFIDGACRFLPHVGDALLAKAMAMKNGLILAEVIGCNNVQAEGDYINHGGV